MYDRFTNSAQTVIGLARQEALVNAKIGTGHILLALLNEAADAAARALNESGLKERAVRDAIKEEYGAAIPSPPSAQIPFLWNARKVMEGSLEQAAKLGHTYIGPEHFLLAITRLSDCTAAKILKAHAVDLDALHAALVARMEFAAGKRPRNVVHSWVAAFNDQDADGLAELYTEDAVNHQVALEPVKGREAIREMFAREFAQAEMVCEIENLFEEGQWAILEWIDPLGMRGCGFFRVVGGLIAFQRGYWDKLTFLKLQGLPLPDEL